MYDKEGMKALLRDVRRVIGSEGRKKPAPKPVRFDDANFQRDAR